MRRLREISATLMLLAGCGFGSSAGHPCTVRTDCDPAQTCFTDAPGGFCSKACAQEGTDKDCPSGTLCTYVGGTDLICSPTCTSDGDCRDQYTCADVPGSTVKACKPK